MDQFHSDSYKKQNLMQEFFNSCLGRLVILLIVFLVLYIFALITVPSKKLMLAETIDNIHECIQDNDSIKADEIDELINNISRTISVADTALTNPEVFNAFLKYNRLQVFQHPGFLTVHVYNGIYPQGRRISIGVFQTVISTLNYDDLVLSTGAVRGDYNKQLTAPVEVPDTGYIGENANIEPYHFMGDEDN